MAIDTDILFHAKNMISWGELNAEDALAFLDSFSKLAEAAASTAGEDDKISVQLENGSVINPSGLMKAYRDAGESDFIGMTSEEFGIGAPVILQMVYYDIIAAGHNVLQLRQFLTDDAVEVLTHLAPSEIQKTYIPRMTSGEWAGAMVMTEQNAGSDLGQIVTRITDTEKTDENGLELVKVSGTKTFITNPDAGVHLVLARDNDTYDEKKGTTKGLSMVLVPIELSDGKGNSVAVTGLEHKMGIKASATGTLQFEDALGYRIGEKGLGMTHFFRLMNFARLSVAAQALGIAQAACNYALEYADGDNARVTFGKKISEHLPIAEKLADMKVNIEAGRSLVYAAAQAMDRKKGLEAELGENSDDTELKARCREADSIATTLVCAAKFYLPKLGGKVTSDAVQVLGGYGFMEEYPVARFFRDMKITDLYEGTGEIQALKVAQDIYRGKFDEEFKKIRDYLGSVEGKMKGLADVVSVTFNAFTDIVNGMEGNKPLAAAKVEEVTTMIGKIYSAYLLLQQAQKSDRKKLVAERFIVNHFYSPVARISQDTARTRNI